MTSRISILEAQKTKSFLSFALYGLYLHPLFSIRAISVLTQKTKGFLTSFKFFKFQNFRSKSLRGQMNFTSSTSLGIIITHDSYSFMLRLHRYELILLFVQLLTRNAANYIISIWRFSLFLLVIDIICLVN